MGASVWILLLCAVPAVLSITIDETKLTWTAKLDDSIKKLRMSTDSCRQLSETFGTLAKNLVTIPNSMFTDISPEFTEEEVEQIFKVVFGFDIVNDHQAREKYICEMTRSHTLSQLIQILDDKDVLFNVFRFMYDSTSMWMRVTKQHTSDTPLISFIDAMESAGLMDLDQSRVQWLSHIGSFESYWPIVNCVPVPKIPGSLSAKCNHITSKFMSLVRDKLYQPKYQKLISKIHQIIGLDVTDSHIMEIFFCELIDGATKSGVPGLYEVFQRHGVIWNALKTAYPYIQIYEPIWREQLEIMIQRNTIKPMPLHNFVSKYVPYYPRTYKVLSQYFSTGPTQNRHGLKYDETLPRDPRPVMLKEVMKTVVDFLWKLEASSLLRLPIDF